MQTPLGMDKCMVWQILYIKTCGLCLSFGHQDKSEGHDITKYEKMIFYSNSIIIIIIINNIINSQIYIKLKQLRCWEPNI